jgi:hypothetical protein
LAARTIDKQTAEFGDFDGFRLTFASPFEIAAANQAVTVLFSGSSLLQIRSLFYYQSPRGTGAGEGYPRTYAGQPVMVIVAA